MKALPRFVVLVAFVLLLGPGCAQTSREPASMAPMPSGPARTIGVAAMDHTFGPKLQEREPDAEAAFAGAVLGAILGGAIGASVAIVAMAVVFDASIGLAFMSVTSWEFSQIVAVTGAAIGAPVGAGVGAATAEPATVTEWPLAELEGASELFPDALGEQTLEQAIRDRVLIIAPARTAHALRSAPAEHDATYDRLRQDDLDGLIQLRLLDYGFVGQKGEDPHVALRITAYATTNFIREDRVVSARTRDWVFEGKGRKLSTWMAQDGRLFREELDQAVRELSEQAMNDIFLSESTPAKREKGPVEVRPER